ncbi:MAG: hypothetical protein VX498_11570 [Myxococcota bacterium]|nr:hypothetical protein [Myxococcota bacterium]
MSTYRLFLLSLSLLAALSLGACEIFVGGGGGGDDDDSAVDDDDVADDDDAVDDDDSGDDDDASPPPLSVDAIDIYCEDVTREQTSSWFVTLETTGWADSVRLFIWDNYTFENAHYVDHWQPFDEFVNTDFGPEGAYDIWDIEVTGYSVLGEAQIEGQTILRCYDSNGLSLVELRNYMVCATDLAGGAEHCWFCGDDFGSPAASAEGSVGVVGGFEGPAGDFAATENWSSTDLSSPCIYSSTNL